jgi:hypothetical protein
LNGKREEARTVASDETTKSASRKDAEGGLPTRRKLGDGSEIIIRSALTYIPRRRKARHYADSFSRALLMAKDLPHLGEQFAHDVAPALAEIMPEGVDLLVCPPSSRTSSGRFYFARELTVAVAGIIGAEIGRPLRWAQASGEAAKAIRYQGGHGRKLGRRVEILQDVAGRRVCIIDDLATSGITAALTVEALVEAGAKEVFARTLARTERTEDRPDAERALVATRGRIREYKREGRRGLRKA